MKSTFLLASLCLATIPAFSQIYTPEVKVMQTPNNNVGIGTDNPQTKLHSYKGDGSGTHYWRMEGVSTDASLGLQFRSPSTSMDISTYAGKMGLLGGDIGIGTSFPQSKLDVVGKLRAVEEFTLHRPDPSSNRIDFVNSNGFWHLSGPRTYEGNNSFAIFWNNGSWNRYLTIVESGNIGISETFPSYKLDVNGSARYTSGGLNGSDRRWKKGITTIASASETIDKINPVSYYWRTEEFPDKNFDERLHYGVIAQELEELLPDLVDTDNEGFKSVDYIGLIGILIKGHQEKELEIEKMKGELKSMKSSQQQNMSMLQALTSRLNRLESTSTTSKNIND